MHFLSPSSLSLPFFIFLNYLLIHSVSGIHRKETYEFWTSYKWKRDRTLDDIDHFGMRYLSIFGKNRYPRFLAESRIVLDDRLSTLICHPSTSVERTGSHTFSLKLDTVAGDGGVRFILSSFMQKGMNTEEYIFHSY